jgi:hypothetical protein
MSDLNENQGADSYDVGYRKPPVHTRFQKGCPPPNRRGRPRSRENFADLVRKELRKRIWVQENGKRIRITKREAWMRRVVNGAINGHRRSMKIFLLLVKPTQPLREDMIFYLIGGR